MKRRGSQRECATRPVQASLGLANSMSRTGKERGNLNLSVFVWCMTLLIQYFPQSAWRG